MLPFGRRYELRVYVEPTGRAPSAEWFRRLEAVTAARIDEYLRRMRAGSFRNSKFIGDGVREVRLDFGPGWRVFYGQDSRDRLILPAGGEKGAPAADIARAKRRWSDFPARGKGGVSLQWS